MAMVTEEFASGGRDLDMLTDTYEMRLISHTRKSLLSSRSRIFSRTLIILRNRMKQKPFSAPRVDDKKIIATS